MTRVSRNLLDDCANTADAGLVDNDWFGTFTLRLKPKFISSAMRALGSYLTRKTNVSSSPEECDDRRRHLSRRWWLAIALAFQSINAIMTTSYCNLSALGWAPRYTDKSSKQIILHKIKEKKILCHWYASDKNYSVSSATQPAYKGNQRPPFRSLRSLLPQYKMHGSNKAAQWIGALMEARFGGNET